MCMLIFALVLSATAQQSWDVVKAVPPGTMLRINSSITGRLDSVDDTQITLNGRRLLQDVVSRVERVGIGGRRKRNVGIGILVGTAFGAGLSKANGGNVIGMAWSGSLFGGFAGLIAAATRRSSNIVIYQR